MATNQVTSPPTGRNTAADMQRAGQEEDKETVCTVSGCFEDEADGG